MSNLTWKEWLGIVGVAALVATLTWTGLNLGRLIYANEALVYTLRVNEPTLIEDLQFLHVVRVNTERQQPPPAPQPPQAAPGK